MKKILYRSIFTFLTILVFSQCNGGDKAGEVKLTITGSSTVAPLVMDIATRFESENPGVRVDVQTGGSSRGIGDARSGLAEIGMASRALKGDESDLNAHRLAMDGVCMITHRDNPVTSLSAEQVVAMYTGKTKNWKDLGGQDKTIVVANKAEGRATLEVFLEYFKIDSADIRADVIVGENQQAIKTVAGNMDAIAYVSIGTAAYEADNGTPIRLLSMDGVSPNNATVADGSFPITRPLNLVIKGEATGVAKSFLDYAVSSKVNDLVEKHLFIPVE